MKSSATIAADSRKGGGSSGWGAAHYRAVDAVARGSVGNRDVVKVRRRPQPKAANHRSTHQRDGVLSIRCRLTQPGARLPAAWIVPAPESSTGCAFIRYGLPVGVAARPMDMRARSTGRTALDQVNARLSVRPCCFGPP